MQIAVLLLKVDFFCACFKYRIGLNIKCYVLGVKKNTI